MAGQWRWVKGLVVAGLIGPGLFGAGLSGLARPAAAQEPIDLGRLEVEVGSRASDRVAVLSRSVTVLDREELSVLPVRTVADALEWAIGVDVQPRSPAQADLSVRGAGFEEVLVLVDGVRVSDAQTGHFNLNLPVPLEQVERIEVLRGPASALYGSDAVGGVVNIVTGTPPVGVRASAGSFGALEISASGGASGEAGRWRAGAEHARADGHRPGTDYAITLARAGGELTGGWGRAGLDVSHGRRAFGASGFYAPYDSFERTRTSLAVARWAPPAVGRRTSAPPLSVQGWVREHHDDFILRRDDPEFYRNRHVSRQYGGSLSARGVALGPVQAGVALEAEREDLASSSLGDHRQDRLAAAAELVSDVGPLLLSGGLRGDWYERFGAELAPSLSLALGSPAWPVRVRGAWGRAYRVPSWTERYYRDPANLGNPELEPERSWSVEAGIELYPFAVAGLEATFFRRVARGLIDWARPAAAADTVPWVTRNVDRATFDGLEVTARSPVVAGFTFLVDATWLDVDAATRAGLESKYALRPLTRSVGLTARGGVGDRGVVVARIANERRRGERDRVVADFRLGWDPRPWSVHLDVTNLTDARYLDIAREAAPGRAITLGFGWRLSSGRPAF